MAVLTSVMLISFYMKVMSIGPLYRN